MRSFLYAYIVYGIHEIVTPVASTETLIVDLILKAKQSFKRTSQSVLLSKSDLGIEALCFVVSCFNCTLRCSPALIEVDCVC